jgi:hypothetical protein
MIIKCSEIIEKDLNMPDNTTFTRNSIAYKQDGSQVSANQPRYEDGMFGKAVMIEEATTNLYVGENAFNEHEVNRVDNGGWVSKIHKRAI